MMQSIGMRHLFITVMLVVVRVYTSGIETGKIEARVIEAINDPYHGWSWRSFTIANSSIYFGVSLCDCVDSILDGL